MTAVGYTSGDPSKVDVAGDTMTGDLVLAGAGTDLTVGGTLTDTYQGITGDVMRLLSTALSTGAVSGGTLTINADPTKIDIPSTTGWIVDYNSQGVLGPANPQITYVSYAGASGIVLPGPEALTFFLLNSAGTLIQQPTAPTRTQYRTHIPLGFAARAGLTVVEVHSNAVQLNQPSIQALDYMRSTGGFNVNPTGNVITANGVNLMVNTTGGELFFPSSSVPNYQDPNVAVMAVQAPASFNRMTGTTILAGTFNTIDVANYDPNGLGVIVPIGGGVNTSTIFRVFVFNGSTPANQIYIQYGQSTYANLTAARDALGSGRFVVNPAFVRQALAGWIIATRAATDLSDPTQATFIRAQKFALP